MGAKRQDLFSPIVVAINCGGFSEILDELGIGHLQDHLHDIYREYPWLIAAEGVNEWWVEPRSRESLVHLTFNIFEEKRTPKYLRGWVDTDGFVDEVRRGLIALLKEDLKISMDSEDLPPLDEWVAAVKLVILKGSIVPNSPYVQRVFDGLFPNAVYSAWYAPHAAGARLMPIWRGADVTPIEEGYKPTAAEVLDWRLWQMPSRLAEPARQWLVGFVMRSNQTAGEHLVHHLARLTENQLLESRNLTVDGVEEIKQDLRDHHLWLGMTEDQIDQVRRGLVPATPIAEIGKAKEL